jgi:hypothetical protein
MKTGFNNISSTKVDDLILFIEAMFELWLAKIMVSFLPMKILAKVIRGYMKDAKGKSVRRRRGEVELFIRAIRRADRYSLWKNKCFNKSIALRKMLNRRKIPNTLYLGVFKENRSSLGAHAWVTVGDEIVLGKKVTGRCTVVAWFSV